MNEHTNKWLSNAMKKKDWFTNGNINLSDMFSETKTMTIPSNNSNKMEDPRISKIRDNLLSIKRYIFSNCDPSKYFEKDDYTFLYDVLNCASRILMRKIYISPLSINIKKSDQYNHICSRDCCPQNSTILMFDKKKYLNEIYVCNNGFIHICSEDRCKSTILNKNHRCIITGIEREFLRHFNKDLKFTYYDIEANNGFDGKRTRFKNDFTVIALTKYLKTIQHNISHGKIITTVDKLAVSGKKRKRVRKSHITLRKPRIKRGRKISTNRIIHKNDKLSKRNKMMGRMKNFKTICNNVDILYKNRRIESEKDIKTMLTTFIRYPEFKALSDDINAPGKEKLLIGLSNNYTQSSDCQSLVAQTINIAKDLCPGRKRFVIFTSIHAENVKANLKLLEKYFVNQFKSNRGIDPYYISSLMEMKPRHNSQLLFPPMSNWVLEDIISTVIRLRDLCIQSPYMKLEKSKAINLTNHIVATMYLMKYGYSNIVLPHIMLSMDGYLIDQNDLNKFNYGRPDQTDGLRTIMSCINSLSKIKPV